MHKDLDQKPQDEKVNQEIENEDLEELSDEDLEDVAGGISWHPDKDVNWDGDTW